VRLRVLSIILASATVLGACSLAGGTLGGRGKCWPAEPPRGASIWRGILTMDENGFRLVTPDAEDIWLVAGRLSFRWTPGAAGNIVDRSGNVIAIAGQDITLFGGMGADGGLVVCGLEETNGGS